MVAPITDRAVTGRLAPSPTGALHLGNARSFLIAWLSIRQQAGVVILRIEDIDSPRVKAGAVAATIQDLRWLGLDWDYGPQIGDDAPIERTASDSHPVSDYIQTQRMVRYRSILEQLVADGSVYPCTCSRSEVASSASAPHEQAQIDGPVYSGTCRPRDGEISTLPVDGEYAWRWRFRQDQLQWIDNLLGTQSLNPQRQLGDFVVARRDGTPAYQLAVVIDDFDMNVTEVVRGDDLVFSTYRQQAILRHLSWPSPVYYHLPLMIGPDGRRLAKRHGDTRVSFFRDRSIAPEALVGYLAWTANLIPHPVMISASELVGQLDWGKLPRQASVVDQQSALHLLKQIRGACS